MDPLDVRYVFESTLPSAFKNCVDVPPERTMEDAVRVPLSVAFAALIVPVNVGFALNTRLPDPVSSDIRLSNSEEVTAAVCAVNLSATVVTLLPPTLAAVKFALDNWAYDEAARPPNDAELFAEATEPVATLLPRFTVPEKVGDEIGA